MQMMPNTWTLILTFILIIFSIMMIKLKLPKKFIKQLIMKKNKKF